MRGIDGFAADDKYYCVGLDDQVLNALLPRLQIFNLMTIDEWRYLQRLSAASSRSTKATESCLEYE